MLSPGVWQFCFGSFPGVVLQEELESVQKRATRFVTENYKYETVSILGQLKWESFKKRRKDNRLILLDRGLKGKASIPADYLIPKTRRGRNQHPEAFQTPIANTDVYECSFFPQTIRDWNILPDSLISSAEDAEDSVAKFTSLVRARPGLISLITSPGEWLSFQHFTSNLSWSCHIWTIKAQISLCIHAVWSAPLLFTA